MSLLFLYTLTSLNVPEVLIPPEAYNALYASGGISTSGTLRDVKVYRNNKLIKTIDLYDYITQGNIDQDIRLSNNDVLFVGLQTTHRYWKV